MPVLVDSALRDLESHQLVLFIQSFGIPVESMSKLLATLDTAVREDLESVSDSVLVKMNYHLCCFMRKSLKYLCWWTGLQRPAGSSAAQQGRNWRHSLCRGTGA